MHSGMAQSQRHRGLLSALRHFEVLRASVEDVEGPASRVFITGGKEGKRTARRKTQDSSQTAGSLEL